MIVRLQLYDLVERKVEGDGNCQVYDFLESIHLVLQVFSIDGFTQHLRKN